MLRLPTGFLARRVPKRSKATSKNPNNGIAAPNAAAAALQPQSTSPATSRNFDIVGSSSSATPPSPCSARSAPSTVAPPMPAADAPGSNDRARAAARPAAALKSSASRASEAVAEAAGGSPSEAAALRGFMYAGHSWSAAVMRSGRQRDTLDVVASRRESRKRRYSPASAPGGAAASSRSRSWWGVYCGKPTTWRGCLPLRGAEAVCCRYSKCNLNRTWASQCAEHWRQHSRMPLMASVGS